VEGRREGDSDFQTGVEVPLIDSGMTLRDRCRGSEFEGGFQTAKGNVLAYSEIAYLVRLLLDYIFNQRKVSLAGFLNVNCES
jgi:hypothetical protein